jgi:hypothetical protein
VNSPRSGKRHLLCCPATIILRGCVVVALFVALACIDPALADRAAEHVLVRTSTGGRSSVGCRL